MNEYDEYDESASAARIDMPQQTRDVTNAGLVLGIRLREWPEFDHIVVTPDYCVHSVWKLLTFFNLRSNISKFPIFKQPF